MLRKQLMEFNEIMQGIERIYENYAKSVGLTYMSFTVLSILYHSEHQITQKEICAQCHYSKQIVNTIIKGFHEKKYVSYEAVPEDKRNKYIVFTESGRQYADEIMLPIIEVEEKAMSALSDKERTQMLAMLDKCYGAYRTQFVVKCD